MPKTPPPGHPEQVMRGWTEFTRSGGSWITPLMSLPTKPQVAPEATLAAGAMVTTITATTSLTKCRHCSHKRSRLGAYGARLLQVNKVRCRHCFYKRRGCPRWPMVTSRYARVAWRLRDTSCLLLVDMVLCRHCSHKRRGCLRLGVACGHASPAYIIMCRHCSHKRRGCPRRRGSGLYCFKGITDYFKYSIVAESVFSTLYRHCSHKRRGSPRWRGPSFEEATRSSCNGSSISMRRNYLPYY